MLTYYYLPVVGLGSVQLPIMPQESRSFHSEHFGMVGFPETPTLPLEGGRGVYVEAARKFATFVTQSWQ